MFGRVFKGLHSKDVKQQVQLQRAEHSLCRRDAMLLTSSQAQTVVHVDTVWIRGLAAGEHHPSTNSAKD